MIRGLYTAATGMVAEQFVQDALAGNLANINTAGYKQDVPTFRALHEMALRRFGGSTDHAGSPIGSMGTGVAFDRTVTDTSAGPMMKTGARSDLAIAGPGYFAVMTPQGERYTRNGQFHLQPRGDSVVLADANGNPLLGTNGPIDFKGAEEFSVMADGRILSAAREVGRLKVVDIPAEGLTKQGGSLYSSAVPPVPANPNIRQGFLEQSNVNAVTSMVRMITIQRAYETAARAVTAQDETLGKAVNDVGRT